VKHPAQRRLKTLSQALQVHRHPNPGHFGIAFDPCAGAAGLPIHCRDFTGYHEMMVPSLHRTGSRIGRSG
jgi:hypothetical protein